MLTHRTQSLPWTVLPSPWAPVLPRIKVNWGLAVIVALGVTAMFLVFVGGVVIGWAFSHALTPIAAAEVAAPAPKIAHAVAPAPVTSKTIPVVSVEWALVNAPVIHALFVDSNATLCGVSNTPVPQTWCLKDAKWVGRKATTQEEALIIDRDWREFGNLALEVFGAPPQASAGMVVSSNETIGINREPLGGGYIARPFLHEEAGWVELTPPSELIRIYGFVRIGNQLFLSGWNQRGEECLWRATLKNLP